LECACNMYNVLLKDEAGITFLSSDRRGMLFYEISEEIEKLTSTVDSNSLDSANHAQKLVFRLYGCQCTMAREFFTLLGRIVRSNLGTQHLMNQTNIFVNLLKVGKYSSLDYVSRLALTSLAYTDGGFLSRQLLQYWTLELSCSPSLRQYCHMLLRNLLRSSATMDVAYHDMITSQLYNMNVDYDSTMIYKVVQEATHNKANLRSIIATHPKMMDEQKAQSLLVKFLSTDDPKTQSLLVKFLSVKEGIDFLLAGNERELLFDYEMVDGNTFDTESIILSSNSIDRPIDVEVNKNWLLDALNAWKDRRCNDYVDQIESLITHAFAQSDSKINPLYRFQALRSSHNFAPIQIKTSSFMDDVSSLNIIGGTSSSMQMPSSSQKSNSSGSTASDNNSSNNNDQSWYNSDPNKHLVTDLHGLMRVPWNIEV